MIVLNDQRKGLLTMPHDTFLNLPDEKKQKLDHVLLSIFYDKHISQVKVAEIVNAMDMSRGAFYKYFDDLGDAYQYIVNKYSLIIHQDIIRYIQEDKNQFFLGIEKYLVWCSQLDHNSSYWKSLRLLTEANDLSAYKRMPVTESSPLMKQWRDILDLSQIKMANLEEAVSFLFFIMELVMNALTAFIANDWTTKELITDYRYRVKWIKTGVAH